MTDLQVYMSTMYLYRDSLSHHYRKKYLLQYFPIQYMKLDIRNKIDLMDVRIYKIWNRIWRIIDTNVSVSYDVFLRNRNLKQFYKEKIAQKQQIQKLLIAHNFYFLFIYTICLVFCLIILIFPIYFFSCIFIFYQFSYNYASFLFVFHQSLKYYFLQCSGIESILLSILVYCKIVFANSSQCFLIYDIITSF